MADKINKFRFWCQKVIPLVYDESLSYYEVLCKICDKLNTTITNVNELIDAYNQLKEFFDSDEFKELIEEKLDEYLNGILTNPERNIEKTFEGDTFTLATYNLLSCNYWRYPENPPCDLDTGMAAGSDLITDVAPDILIVNEMCVQPQFTPYEKIASLGFANSHFVGNYPLGGLNGRLGNAIYSVNGLAPGVQSDVYWLTQGDEHRYLTKSVYTINGTPVSIYSTHLEQIDPYNENEITALLELVEADDNTHIIIAGDMNFVYGSDKYNRFISAGFVNVNNNYPTYIGTDVMLDYIFVTPNIKINSYQVTGDSRASDHNMLYASLTI